MYQTIMLEQEQGTAVVTLNRPAVLNALSAAMLAELSRAFAELDKDRSVRAIVLTGAGGKAFAAGADIAEFKTIDSPAAGAEFARRGQGVMSAIAAARAPVIGAVNGFALGGGCELAMACDIRIASENAKFGQPEVSLGLIPGYGGTQRLPRLAGMGAAMYLNLTGEMIDAAEALRIGLVQRVVPLDGLLPEARRIAAAIGTKAPLAIESAKRAIREGSGASIEQALAIEALHFGTLTATEDFREGAAAFLEKRKAAFAGR